LDVKFYSEPNRRAAVQKAVATGTAAMTARIILVQEDADAEISPQFGVLLVQPTFDLSQDISTPAARAGAIHVLLVAAFRMGDLMDSVLARQSTVQDNGLDVRLFEAQTAHPERLLFASDTVVDGPREFTSSISLYGRDWTFQITGARVQSGAVNASSPMIIHNSGILLSLLISAFLRMVPRFRCRRRRKRLAWRFTNWQPMVVNTAPCPMTRGGSRSTGKSYRERTARIG
jgi:CHASE1-domain containing sensor protein